MLHKRRLAIILAVSWLILVILAASIVDKPPRTSNALGNAAPAATIMGQ